MSATNKYRRYTFTLTLGYNYPPVIFHAGAVLMIHAICHHCSGGNMAGRMHAQPHRRQSLSVAPAAAVTLGHLGGCDALDEVYDVTNTAFVRKLKHNQPRVTHTQVMQSAIRAFCFRLYCSLSYDTIRQPSHHALDTAVCILYCCTCTRSLGSTCL